MTDLLPLAPAVRLVSIQLAQEHLEILLDQVEGGQEFWIARDGRPVASLQPLTPEERKIFAGNLARSVQPENF